ncbi:MAG: T9SS type A sorting domain-containing protein [Chitinophagaceae bacterium]
MNLNTLIFATKVCSSKLVLYPNPTKTNITVTGKGIRQIEIFDVMGKKVMAKELNNTDKVNIDIATLNKGLFLVRVIELNGKVNTQKLIKE